MPLVYNVINCQFGYTCENKRNLEHVNHDHRDYYFSNGNEN